MRPEIKSAQDSPARQLTVELYGRLKDQLGFVHSTRQTTATTPAQLWQELVAERLQQHKGLEAAQLAPESIRPVINDTFAAWDDTLTEGDRVAFLPPSSGG